MSDLSYYTVDQLRQFARDNNINIGRLIRKADLIAIIQEHLGVNGPQTPPVPQSPSGPSLQALLPSEDLFYELVEKLPVNKIKDLCSTNRQYRATCQKERFQKLFKRKAAEESEAFYTELAKFISNEAKHFNYQISWKDEGHNLLYINYENHKRWSEEVRVYTDENGQSFKDYRDQSILKQVFGDEAMPLDSRGQRRFGPHFLINNSTVEQTAQVLRALLNKPFFDINKFRQNLSAKELQQICANKREYEILCSSKFYQRLIQKVSEEELSKAIYAKGKTGFIISINGNYSFGYTASNLGTVIESIRASDPDKLSILKQRGYNVTGRPIPGGIMEYTANGISRIEEFIVELIRRPGFDVNSIKYL